MEFFDQPVDWGIVYEWTIVIYLVYYSVLFGTQQIRLYRHIKAVKNSPTPYEFMFNASPWLIIAGAAIFIIPISTMFNPTLWILLTPILAIAVLFLFFNIHLEIYQFEVDRIKRFGEDKLPIIASEITGVTINSEEVNFHSAKFLNHLTFKSKRLKNKEWNEFTEAIEALAERNQIPIEKA